MFPWHWDLATDRVTWSGGIDALLGLPRGKHVRTFDEYLRGVAELDRAQVRDSVERALRGEISDYSVEHRVPAGDGGRVRWVAARGRVFRDATGKPLHIAGVVWDITARKEGQANLARVSRLCSVVRAVNKQILHGRSEAELFESACRITVEMGLFRFAWVGLVTPDGAHVTPAARCGLEQGYLDDVVIDVADTPRGRGPTGIAVREGRRHITDDVAASEDYAPWRRRALERGYRACGAFPLWRAGRVVGTLNVYADRPGVFDDEQVGLLDDLAADLSHALDLLDREARRKEAEAALRTSEERYRAIFTQAFEGIFVVASSNAIVDANESACRMLGYGRDDLLTRRAEDVVHPEDLAAIPLRFGTIPPGGVILSERRFVRKDGTVMQGELSTRHLLDGTYLVVVRDVTDRKAAQAQLLLADRMSSLGRLASGVAHEVNNPLAYVMLNLELVAGRLGQLSPPADPAKLVPLRRSIEDAREGAERMRRIIRTLSTFGRGDEDKMGPVDVNTVLDSAVEMASMQLRHGARITRDYRANVPAHANAFRLGQVFVNLLLNAGDAFREGADDNEITLRTGVRDDRLVVVEVRDNGVGVPDRIQARIFDPFFTTKPIGKGTGLGLAVCHTIVTSFGGEIACQSAPGKGSTFRVVLPSAEVAEEPSVPPRSTGPASSPGRVLVVDDDPRVAEALAAALEGHEVVVEKTGCRALQRFLDEPFDCLLCDVVMPDLSGLDLYEALQRDGRGYERRVVFITGGTISDPARAALARVPNRVLEKPVDATTLLAAVGHVVARSTR